jgi:hypothetical protein
MGETERIAIGAGHFSLLFILTANGFLPGGSDNTIRRNKQIALITQNNTTSKRNIAHKTTHNEGHTTHNEYSQSQLQLDMHMGSA